LYLLKKIQSRKDLKINANFCNNCVQRLERLYEALLNIKAQIKNNDYEEPVEVSTMIWQLSPEINAKDETDFMYCSA
jgi:NMD protein affecting ribosome stability and mRNA decay